MLLKMHAYPKYRQLFRGMPSLRTLHILIPSLALAIEVFAVVSSTFVEEEAQCYVNSDPKETRDVDLSYMFAEEELSLLMNLPPSSGVLPALEALLRPYIELLVTRELALERIDNSSLKLFQFKGNSPAQRFKAKFGSLRMKHIFSTDFKVFKNPVVTLSGSLVLKGMELSFYEYNGTIKNGDYIGYNLLIQLDVEIEYMLALQSKGPQAFITLHQELVGTSPVTFQDFTNCKLVDARPDLNLGRLCGPQLLSEVSEWKGIRRKVVKFIKSTVSSAVYCAFMKFVHPIIELTVSYALLQSN